jgi:hypothetical protein
LKTAGEKHQVICKDKPTRITDFSTELLKARRAWNDMFQSPRENNCQPRLLYQGKVSFITERKIKTF